MPNTKKKENLECCSEGEGEPPGGLPAVAHEGEALEGVLVCGLLGRLLGPGLGAGPHHDHGEHARVHQVLHPVADRVCTQRTFRREVISMLKFFSLALFQISINNE